MPMICVIILPLILLLFVWSQTSYALAYNHRSIQVEANRVVVGPRKQLEVNNHHLADKRNIIIHIPYLLQDLKPENCSDNIFICLKWGHLAQLKIFSADDPCENFEFITQLDEPLTTEFNLTGLHLYGGSEIDDQVWPIETSPNAKVAFVSSNVNSHAVLESYWLDSKGQYLYIDEKVPLFVAQDKTTLNITAERRNPYIRGNTTLLKYSLCTLANSRLAQEHAIANFLGKPGIVPDFKMVQWPIWSTWAKYKAKISEKVVLEFADAISRNELPNSQLEIDDDWETCYGSLTPDTKRFPDMKKLVDKLKRRGYRVTIWIHPFVNVNCEPYFSTAKEADFLVKNLSGEVVATWWNGAGGYIDFTNLAAAEWWTGRLKSLLNQTGIDSFKFDAGESSWGPQLAKFHNMTSDHPETILKAYVNTVISFGNMIEVRVGRGTQATSPFVRMIDRETTWYSRLGLNTLIPTLLHMNIVGYPMVLPDMIGGNGYGSDHLTEEMFIRWLQINVFMPCLQFSYPPWTFSEKTVNLTKKFINLHASYANKIHDLMVEATKTGTPVNLPIWWMDPTDEVALGIGSEFLLGEDLLVAPVLDRGALSRDIYLPKGKWKDENHPDSQLIVGPTWLKDYAAGLNILPYFTCVEKN